MITKMESMFWFMLLLLWPTTMLPATGSNIAKSDRCLDKCGEVVVPYPFGIDDSNCARNEDFLLNCTHSFSPPKLMVGGITILNISVENGTILASILAASRCYNNLGGYTDLKINVKLGSRPLRFSDRRNKLTAFGCDTMATISDVEGSFISGCLSLCTAESEYVNQTQSCSGIGCCQTPLPKSLKTLNISLGSFANHTLIGKFKRCDYAILADETFDISRLRQSVEREDDFITSNATIEWVVKEETCETSRNSSDYACKNNTQCDYSENGKGYRCLCNQGF